MIVRTRFFFQGLAYSGFLLVLLFSVKTFEEAIPDKMYVELGEEVTYDFGVPVTVVLKEDAEEVFGGNGNPYRMRDKSYTVTCMLFGCLPVKDVEVTLIDGTAVYAGGTTVGIYAKMNGVLVIGTGNVALSDGEEKSPAENLVKGGDYIVSVNGEMVDEKEALSELINTYGQEKEVLGIIRNDEYIEVAATPVKAENEQYMLGIWVRDDLAGIGTLTYYTEEGKYGALGHPVSDGDTGTRVEVKQGDIYEADIVGIRRGEDGNPGEISGVINYGDSYKVGTIEKNCEKGIYGTLNGNQKDYLKDAYFEVAYKQDIVLGKAYILSDVSGEIEQYEIEIQSLDFSGREENKGILIHVTDEKLLRLTGGIVQGMSGSPVIQNGRIIGAVTHVLVNDPTKGYGIFIENMLEHDN